MAQSGKIQAITGLVTARTPEGAVRELQVGDIVYENEIIETSIGASVSIIQEDGQSIAVAESDQILLDESVNGNIASTDAVIQEVAELQAAIVQAVENNTDIDDLLEDPAAGGLIDSYDFRTGYHVGDTTKGDVGTYLLDPDNNRRTQEFEPFVGDEPEQENDGSNGSTDDTPAVTVSDSSVAEGNNASFSVVLAAAAEVPVAVNLALASGTAETDDYGPGLTVSYTDADGATQTLLVDDSGNVLVPPGVTELTVSVATTNDSVFEGPETFTLTATTATGSDAGTATIYDDGSNGSTDDTPAITVSDSSVAEGNNASFSVVLAAAAEVPVAVNLALASGTAETDDYGPGLTVSYTDADGATQTLLVDDSGNVLVPPGVTELTVSVATTNDSVFEGPETFTLTATTATGSDAGTATIYDDGSNGSTDDTPAITVSDSSVAEGNNASFSVVLAAAAEVPVAVNLALASGTAETDDYGPGLTVSYTDADGATQTLLVDDSGNVLVPPGVTELTVSVATTNDSVFEGPETFTLTATTATGSDTGTATIYDDTDNTVIAVDDPNIADSAYSVYLADRGVDNNEADNWYNLDSTGQQVKITALNVDGTTGTLFIGQDTVNSNPNVLGVSGTPRVSSGVPDQIEYDKKSGSSEAILFEFNGNVNEVTFDVSRLYATESGGEQGQWIAYSNGTVVATGTVRLESGNTGSEVVINTGDYVFDTLKFTALPYATDGGGNDASDYFITGLSATGPASANSIYQTAEDTSLKTDFNISLLNNDIDPEGNSFTLTAIEGITLGDTANLTSGATVVANADGTFVYDPNGAFDSLGAGEVATDSFEYTITDQFGAMDTAVATVTIIGKDSPATVSMFKNYTNEAGEAELITGSEGTTTSGITASSTGSREASIPAGGDGNDTIILDATATHIDGGTGIDTLMIADAVLDFSNITNGTIENTERLDLKSNQAQSVSLTLEDVLDMTGADNVLEVTGGKGDVMTLNVKGSSGIWTHQGDGLFSNDTDHVQIVAEDTPDNLLHIVTDDGTPIG